MTRLSDPAHASNGAPARRRPTTVTVLAGIGLVLAAVTIACDAVSTLALVVGSGQAATPDANALTAAVRAEPVLIRWYLLATVVRLALGFVLLIGSLGALGLRGWGRWLMLAYAMVALPLAVTDTVMTVKYLVPIVERLAVSDPNVQGIASKQHLGVPLKLALGCAYPVLVLVFMNRRHVRAAFARDGGQASGGMVPERAGR